MKLDFNTIKALTVGAVDIWQENDGIHFAKCTKDEIAAWGKIDDFLQTGATATTGIRLDFHTNATFVTVNTSQGGKYEVIVDDIAIHSFAPTETNRSFTLQLGSAKQKHVVVVLPSHGVGVIDSIEIDDNTSVQPHFFDMSVVFYGDSITQGWNSQLDCMSYAYQLSRMLNANSTIKGIGGARFEPTTIADNGLRPDVVFVALGTNDFSFRKSMADVQNHAEAYLQKIRLLYSAATVFVISPVWRKDCNVVKECGTFDECCKVIQSVSDKLGLNTIDGSKLLPHNDCMMDDDVHPNDLGFSQYAINLLYTLRNYTKS